MFHVRHVSKTYIIGEVEALALRPVTLDLHEGEFVVLLGSSGSALFRWGASWSVFAMENHRARARDVEVGHRIALDAEVIKRLAREEPK